MLINVFSDFTRIFSLFYCVKRYIVSNSVGRSCTTKLLFTSLDMVSINRQMNICFFLFFFRKFLEPQRLIKSRKISKDRQINVLPFVYLFICYTAYKTVASVPSFNRILAILSICFLFSFNR